jgi:hypothetical protein
MLGQNQPGLSQASQYLSRGDYEPNLNASGGLNIDILIND